LPQNKILGVGGPFPREKGRKKKKGLKGGEASRKSQTENRLTNIRGKTKEGKELQFLETNGARNKER